MNTRHTLNPFLAVKDNALKTKLDGSRGAWKVTSGPNPTPDGESRIMHATDLSGATWIFQQDLKPE